MTPLVSTAWLADHLTARDVRIVDATWFMPGDGRLGRPEYDRRHIPGAVFFDIDAIADSGVDLPHMAAAPETFARMVGELGVGSGDSIVVYDQAGLFSAARVWWNFRLMGHAKVQVLDGGLPRWIAEGRPTTAEPTAITPRRFEARPQPQLVRDLAAMRQALASPAQIIDARAADRFAGASPEPRAGLRSGHMPGAFNLPWQTLVRGGALLPPDQLEAAFKTAEIDLSAPIVTTCGSGISAATLALALARLGRFDVPVYDGSWTQWGGRSDTEVVGP